VYRVQVYKSRTGVQEYRTTGEQGYRSITDINGYRSSTVVQEKYRGTGIQE